MTDDRTPPRTVRWVAGLLLTLAALAAADSLTAFVVRRGFDAATPALLEAAPAEARQYLAEVGSGLSFSAYANGLFAVGTVALAFAVRRSTRWSRWTALLAMTGYLLAQLVFVAANPAFFEEAVDRPGTSATAAAWDAMLPDWYTSAHHLVEVPMVLATVAVLWLLMTDSAKEFYRRLLDDDDPRIWQVSRLRP